MTDLEEKYLEKLKNYYNPEGLLKQYPGKRPLRMIVLERIYDKFESDKEYSEKQVNEIIQSCIAYTDVETIRRELIDYRFLSRLRDGSKYWKGRYGWPRI